MCPQRKPTLEEQAKEVTSHYNRQCLLDRLFWLFSPEPKVKEAESSTHGKNLVDK